MKRKGGREKGEAVKQNKAVRTDKRKQTQINQDILWGGGKTREMRQSLHFESKDLVKCHYKNIFNHIMHNEEEGNNNEGV